MVALYGPILDTSSLGELAMTKMTVLYAVFVAFMAWSSYAATRGSRRRPVAPSWSAATAVGADAPTAAALAEAALAVAGRRPARGRGQHRRRPPGRRLGALRRLVDRHRAGRAQRSRCSPRRSRAAPATVGFLASGA